MTGIARKKENSVAARRERPSTYPPMIVAPERDVPGTSESTWASPIPSAVRAGTASARSTVSRGGHRSISRITIPPTTSAAATTGIRKRCSLIQSWARKPTTAAGRKAISRFSRKRRLGPSVRAASTASMSRAR